MSLPTLRRVAARIAITSVVATSAGLAAGIVATTAHADSTYSMEAQFVSLLNSARQANGQQPYVVMSDLTSIARGHSQTMAQKQELYHNPGLTTQVQNWQAVGENVGEGPTVGDVHNAFMHSTEHRDNILDHDFTQVGLGVAVDGNGIVWVTEDFREPMNSGSSSAGSSSGSAPTHHARQPAASAPTQRQPQPAQSSRQSSATSAAIAPVASTASTPHAGLPRPATSPRARLMARLHAIQNTNGSATGVDPVAQAFDYVSTLTQLTSNA